MNPEFWLCRIAVLLILFLSTFSVHAQKQKPDLETQKDSLIAALHKKGVDTICVYEAYCVGCRSSKKLDTSPCNIKEAFDSPFVFWKRNNRTFLAYLGSCPGIKPLTVRKDRFWYYLDEHKSQIRDGEIEDFSLLDNRTKTIDKVRSSHGDVYSFSFFLGHDTISQYFKGFALLKSTKLRTHINNFYYRKNKASPIRKIQLQLEKAVVEAKKRIDLK